MQSPIQNPENPIGDGTVMDVYLALHKRGPEYRRQIAMQIWRKLTPVQQLAQQQAAHSIACGNLALSEEYTQSVLLLEYANSRTVVTGQIVQTPAVLPEVGEPSLFDGDALGLPPAA
jgi:hypothetical protein